MWFQTRRYIIKDVPTGVYEHALTLGRVKFWSHWHKITFLDEPPYYATYKLIIYIYIYVLRYQTERLLKVSLM